MVGLREGGEGRCSISILVVMIFCYSSWLVLKFCFVFCAPVMLQSLFTSQLLLQINSWKCVIS